MIQVPIQQRTAAKRALEWIGASGWILEMKYLLFHYTSVEIDVCKRVVYRTVLHYHPLLVSYFLLFCYPYIL